MESCPAVHEPAVEWDVSQLQDPLCTWQAVGGRCPHFSSTATHLPGKREMIEEPRFSGCGVAYLVVGG